MPTEPECVWNLGAELGEGPMWSAADRSVWFVDIKKRQIHRYTPEGEATQSWDAPDQTGFVLPLEGGGMVAGVRGGLQRFDPESGRFDLLQPVEPEQPENRLNDGYVDAQGRLWFGTMSDSEGGEAGSLYRWDGAGAPKPQDSGYVITNGPTASPDGRTLYHTDTRRRTIFAFDLSPEGELSNKREFVRFQGDEGNPDGPVCDAEGCVWTSMFRGWGVRRYSPAGELLEFVRFPVANITKVAFGGDDLRTVYATTARLHLTDQARAEQTLAGGLFSFRVETPGLPQNAVRLAG